MTDLDIIPGYPSPTLDQIKLFQRNNKLEPDGDIGPKTRAAIWREAREGGRYTFLGWHRVKRGGAESTIAFVTAYLETLAVLPLEVHQIEQVIRMVSSEFKTGLDFLSTQDGITFGMRRLAAGTLRKFCQRNRQVLAPHLGAWGMHLMAQHRDRPNNGSPLNDPGIRLGWIEAARDRAVWEAQLAEFVETLRKLLLAHTWLRISREIVLAMRIHNSGSALVDRYAREHGKSYAGLVRGYTKRGGRGAKRIARIEKTVREKQWR